MKIEKEMIKKVFNLDSIIPRLIASWMIVVSFLLFKNVDYTNIEFSQNESLIAVAILLIVSFMFLSFIKIIIKKIESDSLFLFIFSTINILFWILNKINGLENVLLLFGFSIIYFLVIFYFYRKNKVLFDDLEINKVLTYAICIMIVFITFTILNITLSLKYLSYGSPNFDFGIFVNTMYNIKTKGLPLVTCERDVLMSHFSVHISPVLYLVYPFYLLFPNPITIQIVGSLFSFLGIIPILLISNKLNKSSLETIIITIIFALYPALSSGSFYDFHENCFLSFFLLMAFSMLELEKPVLMFIFSLLVLTVKEDASVYLAIFSLFIIFDKKKYVQGSILFVVSVVYFIIAVHILNTTGYGAMTYRYDNLIYNDSGLLGMIKTILLNPGYAIRELFMTSSGAWDKLQYFIIMMLPLGFTPLITKKPSRLILVLPLLLNLLTRYIYQYNINFQYNYGILSFLIYASILNVEDFNLDFKSIVHTISLSSVFIFYLALVLPSFYFNIRNYRANKELYESFDTALESIPKDASVLASTFILPHIANRDTIYELEYHDYKTDIEYVAIDLRYSAYNSYRNWYRSKGYTEYYRSDYLIILKIE